jgi:hypothetical protein
MVTPVSKPFTAAGRAGIGFVNGCTDPSQTVHGCRPRRYWVCEGLNGLAAHFHLCVRACVCARACTHTHKVQINPSHPSTLTKPNRDKGCSC